MKQSKKGPRANNKGDSMVKEERAIVRRMDNTQAQTMIVRRILTTSSVISTSGAGFIAATTVASSDVTGANDWSSFASRYGAYRVKAIRLRLFPIVTVSQAAAGVAVTPPPGPILVAVVKNGRAYTNFASKCSGADAEWFGVCEKVDKSVDWRANPDAHLWTDVATTIPAEQRFGLEYSDPGSAPASAATTQYFRSIVQFEAEFNVPT
jgi:hypothetical protein